MTVEVAKMFFLEKGKYYLLNIKQMKDHSLITSQKNFPHKGFTVASQFTSFLRSLAGKKKENAMG